ncbi:uncharacterized protein LOC131643012 isoform X2 [Vicia villosa]|uniref:uncharacterized protein LOC131643012 isoform X2 n=1 Tax=Vicia villosa TaxID=3911 RepID=UPI00273B55FA|nr:uncharacterized protein LOC131643012 isoform X2 [Vicia villosa]
MGRTIHKEKDVEFDIESGENTSEEETSNDERDSRNGFPWSWNGVLNLDGSEKGKNGIESCSNSSNSGDFVGVEDYNLELLVDKGLEHVHGNHGHHGKHGKQKSMFGNPRKPQKPPLPPKGPSLDAGDHRFVKELAELALRKRARVKKMNAVKRMKAGKPPSTSSYTNLSAMVITIVFFLVIILHGIRSASSAAVGLTASPETTVVADESLISIQYPANFNSTDGNGPGSHFPSLQEG